jgi:hypothetical protein
VPAGAARELRRLSTQLKPLRLTRRAVARVALAAIHPGLCDDGHMVNAAERERVLSRIREICLALPEASERLSHGAPTFFVREKRAFLMVVTNHHGDGRFAIWCAAGPGTQQILVDADPERFFRPPYVGHRGWLGVRLDRGLDWDELAGIAEDAYAEVAPAKLVEAARLATED